MVAGRANEESTSKYRQRRYFRRDDVGLKDRDHHGTVIMTHYAVLSMFWDFQRRPFRDSCEEARRVRAGTAQHRAPSTAHLGHRCSLPVRSSGAGSVPMLGLAAA